MATTTRRPRPLGRALLRAQPDDRLVALIRQGREPAFEELVRRYRPGLVAFAAAYAPSDRAEDVVQESLVKSWNALRDSDAEIRLKPWLYTIVRNRALNARRDARVHEQLDESIDGVRTPEQLALDREELDRVVAAVGALPEPQRRALVRSALEGHSHDQIAESLGSSPGSVRQLIYRGRAGVREAIGALVPLPLVAALAGGGAGPAAIGAGAGAAGAGGAGPLAVGAAALAVGAIAIGAGLGTERSRGTAGAETGHRPEQRAAASGQSRNADSAENARGEGAERAEERAERREELRERLRERREEVRERRRERAEERRDRAQDAAGDRRDAEQELVEEAEEAAEEAFEQQQDAAEDAADAAEEAAEDAVEAAEESADAAEDAADAADEGGDGD